MIVKIWPIKGAQGMKNAMLYIQDDNKVRKIEKNEQGKIERRKIIETQREYHQDADSFFLEHEENISRIFDYMSDEDKTENKYISGYMCHPDNALKNFRDVWNNYKLFPSGRKLPKNKEDGNMSFHLVQSFPEELNISDEEVHQCGLELLQKIDEHQGLVCSHVHPVVDEKGEVHGRCKHNHILINAYIHPSKYDSSHPNRIKYNDCNATYSQLQIWNDEIAIEHGLPIISNPDPERVYSWKKNYEATHGNSWTKRIQLDIEAARRVTHNWNEFKAYMEQFGYSINEGKHVTYTAPDGTHKARGGTLGRQYTKANLELYWTLQDHIEKGIEVAVKNNEAPPLWNLSWEHGPLTVNIPLGGKTGENHPSYPLPLNKADRTREVLSTYFNDTDLYDVHDSSGNAVRSATGRELIDYLDDLRRGEDERWRKMKKTKDEKEEKEHWDQEEFARRIKALEEEKKQKTYTYRFRNSRTKRLYSTDLWDENGRKRSTLELAFMLACVVLKSEGSLWEPKGKIPEDRKNDPIFGRVNWKLQNMMDSIHLASEEGIDTQSELNLRVNEAGAEYSRARSNLQKTQRAEIRMSTLAKALDDYDCTKELAERIQALLEGPEKERLQQQYEIEIGRYRTAKAVMYGYKVTTQNQIDDFRIRYADIKSNIPAMQERLNKTKEQYRKLKKLQYNVALAQMEHYCYGPNYCADANFSCEELVKQDKTIKKAEYER